MTMSVLYIRKYSFASWRSLLIECFSVCNKESGDKSDKVEAGERIRRFSLIWANNGTILQRKWENGKMFFLKPKICCDMCHLKCVPFGNGWPLLMKRKATNACSKEKERIFLLLSSAIVILWPNYYLYTFIFDYTW